MKTLLRFLSFAATAALFTAPALADTVTYTLTTVNPSAPAGSTLTFNGSIVAPPNNLGAIYLVSDTYNVADPLSVSDEDFVLDTPLSLEPGQSYEGALFTVTLPGTATPGTYAGVFTIDFADSQNNTFAEDAPFQATVTGATVTPEPGTWLLLSTGLAGAWILCRRVERRTA